MCSSDLQSDGHNMLYTGATVFQQLHPYEVWAAPLVGYRLTIDHFSAGLEAKWINPWEDESFYTVRWYGPGRHGALAVQLGLGWTFAGGKTP